MSVMWYYYLKQGEGLEKLHKNGFVEALSFGKVYRLDNVDKTHHECFHQLDGIKLKNKELGIITDSDVDDVLRNISTAVFGQDLPKRKKSKKFPFTDNGYELEVNYKGIWIKVAGAGLIDASVLDNLGVNPDQYTGWAFGVSLERIAMLKKKIPDIRYLRDFDTFVTNQRKDMSSDFIEKSKFPSVYRDISLLVEKSKINNSDIEKSKIFSTIKDIIIENSNGLCSDLSISDVFENEEKLGVNNVSVSFKIEFNSNIRTLNNDEINKLYHSIRNVLSNKKFSLR